MKQKEKQWVKIMWNCLSFSTLSIVVVVIVEVVKETRERLKTFGLLIEFRKRKKKLFQTRKY
jgi:hypothetical protein